MNEKGYTLYIVEGDLVRKYNTEEFQKREITIGSANTDILVEANTISKVHLRINLRNDKLYFADTDSREGSFMYNNTEFQQLESMKFYKKEGQDTVIRLGNSVLVIIADNKGESEYLKANIEKGVRIGRSRENDIVLNHLGISQRHAEILPAEKGNIDMLYVYGNKRNDHGPNSDPDRRFLVPAGQQENDGILPAFHKYHAKSVWNDPLQYAFLDRDIYYCGGKIRPPFRWTDAAVLYCGSVFRRSSNVIIL